MANVYDHYDPKPYRVKTRMGEGWHVKPEAVPIEGKVYLFSRYWEIDDIEMYKGELAMRPESPDYPKSAPKWIASGDLEPA